MSGYTVQRNIEDIEFPESEIETIRGKVRTELVEESESTEEVTEEAVEQRLEERLESIAKERTAMEQGDNRLHLDISHELVE